MVKPHGSSPWHKRQRRDAAMRVARAEKHERRRTKVKMREPLSWTCHICGEERPDELIAVMKADASGPDLPPGTIGRNYRYCTDKVECVIGAREKVTQVQSGGIDALVD
jgi:hypothetical protein